MGAQEQKGHGVGMRHGGLCSPWELLLPALCMCKHTWHWLAIQLQQLHAGTYMGLGWGRGRKADGRTRAWGTVPVPSGPGAKLWQAQMSPLPSAPPHPPMAQGWSRQARAWCMAPMVQGWSGPEAKLWRVQTRPASLGQGGKLHTHTHHSTPPTPAPHPSFS